MIRNNLKKCDSTWGCKVTTQNIGEIDLLIFSDEVEISSLLVDFAEHLCKFIDQIDDNSRSYISTSVYRNEFKSPEFLIPVGLHIHSMHEYRYWLAFDSNYRYISVKYVNGHFFDIYCDSP